MLDIAKILPVELSEKLTDLHYLVKATPANATIKNKLTPNSNQIQLTSNARLKFKIDEWPKRDEEKVPEQVIWHEQPINPSVHKVDGAHKQQQHQLYTP